MTIKQLSEKRKELRQQLIENGAMEGFKGLLTLLYSDKVHFIYELLQNAEDAKASEVKFFLNTDRLEFEHNGTRLFTIEDVDSITNIGSTTKADDVTSIGKFGIGFKAVFAYTSTPKIESGPYHFRIHDMFVPETENLPPGALGERRTRFVFPFDNPDKSPKQACTEIEDKLQQLNENTLMFLSNIRKIEYYLPDSTIGFLERRESTNDKNQIEISVMCPGNIAPDSIHYLRFTKEVNVRDEDGESKCCRIAVAFGIDKSKDKTWKITPLNSGQVCIYFPATKEESKLRFHMHAPYASTVARNSVRDCPANDELQDHLAVLVAESMHAIRDRELLDVEFLATLPNDRDYLSPLYFPIQKQLIKEFNRKKLVPMKQGGHAIASEAYRTARGERGLSDLIEDEDLGILLGKDSSLQLWIANPPRLDSSREDNFLTMLDVSEWTIEDLIEILQIESDQTTKWLKEKECDWHQQLYTLLGDFLSSTSSSHRYFIDERKDRLSKLQIVRCSDGEYRIGSECHFSDDNEMPEEGFNYVEKGVYSSGQNRNQQKKSRAFLEEIGVHEVDEAERVKMILKHRYKEDCLNHVNKKQHIKDMKRFIALVDEESDYAKLFKNYNIFETIRGPISADRVFLDSPYLDTGLSVSYEDEKYWEMLDNRTVSPYFSLLYKETGIDLKKLGEFAEKLGAKTKLKAIPQGIPSDHPEINTDIWWKHYKTSINSDYFIPEFEILISKPTIDKSKLIWQTMCSVSSNYLEAKYRYNRNYPLETGFSSLVWILRQAEWVPQREDNGYIYVRPCDALIKRLPGGFPYDAEQEWLEAIEFEKIAKQQQKNTEIEEQRRLQTEREEDEKRERNQQAREFGYDSVEEAEEAAALLKDWKAQGKTPEQLRKKITPQKRREVRLIEELGDAPEKEYEQRARSVRVSRGAIEPKPYLIANYTDDNKMVCQMCEEDMPFKKRNSHEDYFEAVEALRKDCFPIEHRAQYLSFCPECAAKYKEFIKRDPKARVAFHKILMDSEVPEISLQTNGETIHIWFAEKHWNDLKTVLFFYENVYNPEDSTD